MNQLKIMILMISVASLSSGCSVTPIIEERSTIPFNENEVNGGIIRDFEDYSAEIAPYKRDQYNDRILKHEGILKYPFKKDFGVTPMENGNYRITAEAREYWYYMVLEDEDLTK